MRTITCDRCGGRIHEQDLHVLRLELTNAVPTAPGKHTVRDGGFCPKCAAATFRAFKEPLPEVVAA